MSQLGETVKNVMLNLFQHPIESDTNETLNQVQGDKKGVTTQPRGERGSGKLYFDLIPSCGESLFIQFMNFCRKIFEDSL